MNIRKNRIPLQGISNFHMTQADKRTRPKNVWNPIQQFKAKNIQFSERPASRQAKIVIPLENRALECPSKHHYNKSMKEIRKAYKSKSNIWRMAKAWKFPENGYITTDQFKEKARNFLGIDISPQQAQELFTRFGITEGKIDIKNFLKIVYSEDENFAYNPRLFKFQDQNEARKTKIDNLIDKLDIYDHAFQRKKHSISQQICQRGKTNDRIKEGLTAKQQFNKTGIQKFSNRQFNKDQFYRLTQQSFSQLRLSKKERHMHPEEMRDLDQTKTRLGATPFNFSRQGIFSGSQTAEKNSKGFWPLENIKNFADIEKNEKKLKLQKRIEKIREAQKIQKQNIQRIQDKEQEREKGTLLRKRMDRQAYQYASFVKNKWL